MNWLGILLVAGFSLALGGILAVAVILWLTRDRTQ